MTTELQLVFAETSPFGSLEAVIEQDDCVAYFYLRPLEENRFGMKSCWVRNLVESPETFETARMKQGKPPILPKEHCSHPLGAQRLDERDLRVVWFEEGDGAALLESDQVIAVIPPWSGMDGFSGYASECNGSSPVASELPADRNIIRRIEKADRYWKSWSDQGSPWLDLEPRLLEAYRKCFGEPRAYYSIDGGGWPPRAMAKYESDGKTILASVGVSVCPQPTVELHFETSSAFRRFELACCLGREVSQSTCEQMMKYLSGQVALPWNQITFFAHGHTVECSLFSRTDELPDFSSVLLWKLDGPANTAPALGEQDGDPVNLLWLIPLYESERRLIAETGNYELVDQILAESVIPVVQNRKVIG